MTNHLVVGISDKEYGTIKLSKPIIELLQFTQGTEYLKNMIQRHIIPNLKEGHVLINNNIPEKIFREAGLKDRQFIPNQLKTVQEKPVKKAYRKTR